MEFQPILSIIFLHQLHHSQHKQQMQQCLLRQQVIKSKIESFIKDRLQSHLRMHRFSMLCLLPAPTNNNILPSLLVLHHN